ncbi:MAG: response regulator [Phycisphaerales bacterium]
MKARKQSPLPGPSETVHQNGRASAPAACRVLIVHHAKAARNHLVETLRAAGMTCEAVSSLRTARAKLAEGRYDAALLAMKPSGDDALDLARDLASDTLAPAVVMLKDEPNLDDAVLAMRAGAMDLLCAPYDPGDVAPRVRAAADAARRDRSREEQLAGLKSLCRELNASRDSANEKVGSLCDELADAYHQITEQVQHVKAAAEFTALIRQELDVESGLRTALEYLLTKTGPTNAAVFLPGDHGEFSLGAYVNYDCPRDSADVLLDSLANVLAPRFADDEHLSSFDGEEHLRSRIGDDAHWLADNRALVLPCRHDDECMAVMVFFRDRLSPYPTDAMGALEIVGKLFAEQLDRIVRVHGRAVPGDEAWPDEDAFGGGMAA